MKIAIPAEIDAAEPRVAATPDTVKKMKALGADVVVETGAGREVRHPRCRLRGGRRDASRASAADAVRDADVVLKVRRPTDAKSCATTSRARWSSRSWTRTATRPRSPTWRRPASSASRWS